MPTELLYIFRKFESCRPSSLGGRSFAVSRLAGRPAGWQAGRPADDNGIVVEFLKIRQRVRFGVLGWFKRCYSVVRVVAAPLQ